MYLQTKLDNCFYIPSRAGMHAHMHTLQTHMLTHTPYSFFFFLSQKGALFTWYICGFFFFFCESIGNWRVWLVGENNIQQVYMLVCLLNFQKDNLIQKWWISVPKQLRSPSAYQIFFQVVFTLHATNHCRSISLLLIFNNNLKSSHINLLENLYLFTFNSRSHCQVFAQNSTFTMNKSVTEILTGLKENISWFW